MDQESRTLQTSNIQTWVGTVAADKAATAITIEVFIPELFPTLTGAVGAGTTSHTSTLKDLDGNEFTSSVQTKTTVTAYYHGGDTNRAFPPDVVKGEQVKITKYATADKYYWESMGRDDQLRYTETHRIEVKNRKDFSDPSDDSHTYSIEIDSKRSQHIRLLTSKGNGEPYAYTLLLDTKNGRVQLADDVGNAFTIDSANAKVIMRNADKSFMMLNGQDAFFAAPRDVTIKAGRQLLIDSPLVTVNTTADSGIFSVNSKSISMNATSSVVTKAPAIGLTGAVQIPTTLTVGQIKTLSMVQGAPAAPYQGAQINISAGTGNTPSVAPDATMAGLSVIWSTH